MKTVTPESEWAHTDQYRRAATRPPGEDALAMWTIVFLLVVAAIVVGVVCLLAGLYA